MGGQVLRGVYTTEESKDCIEGKLRDYCSKVLGDGTAYIINWSREKLLRYYPKTKAIWFSVENRRDL